MALKHVVRESGNTDILRGEDEEAQRDRQGVNVTHRPAKAARLSTGLGTIVKSPEPYFSPDQCPINVPIGGIKQNSF